MTKTATITLRRHQWAEIVEQFRFYCAATPTHRLVSPLHMESMNSICRGIVGKLPAAGDSMQLTGPFAGWVRCTEWILHIMMCPSLAETGALLAAQLAAQESFQGVPAGEAA